MTEGEPSENVNVLLPGNRTVVVKRASQVAIELIRSAILEGRIAPGERLKESSLARDLGISRTPIREALLVLEAEGLIESTPNRGAAVRDYSEADLADMYDLRAHLESYAARRAATRISPQQVEILESSCDRFSELLAAGDLRELTPENLRFHYTIAEAAQSPKLVTFVRGAIELPLVNRSFFMFSVAEAENSERLHRSITAALKAGDAERAELLMKEHIFEGRDLLVAHLRAYREQ